MNMTRDELMEIARRFVDETFNNRNLHYAEVTLVNDFVENSPPLDLPADKSGAITRIKQFLDASEDLRAEILDVVTDGHHLAIRVRYSGTDTGGVVAGIPATCLRFDVEGADIFVLNEDGLFVERYGMVDMKDVMQQLGLGPFVDRR